MLSGISKSKLLIGVTLVVFAIIINIGPRIARSKTSSDAPISVWGANNFGQNGTENTVYAATVPFSEQVSIPHVTQMALGLNHSLALTNDGNVYGWGSNLYGQIGQPAAFKQRAKPSRIEGLPKISGIAASQDHSLAVAEDGSVWAWGLNMSGQLGNGTNADSHKPIRVSGISDIKMVAAGYRTSLALTQNGVLWAWGGDCQLNTTRDQNFRDAIAALAIDGAYSTPSTASAKTGSYISLSPEEDCINEDVVGIKSVVPKRIEGLPPLRTVSAGFGHMLAIDESNGVWAWGCNTYGQVGNGTVGRGEGANLVPAKVPGIQDAVQVSAGFRHSLVLQGDGSLWSWGHNHSGALGTGIVEDQNPRPSRVGSVPALRKISAGHDYSVAIAKDGSGWGWGDGSAWKFSAEASQRKKPLPIWHMQNVSSIVAGGGHVAAQQQPGTKKVKN